MLLDAAALSHSDMYKILIGAIAPRPIAWVGSRSLTGQNNLAPFSFFNCVSAQPPIIAFSTIPRPDGRKKDTLQNIEENPGFTLNCASHALAPAMSRSAALFEPGESEFDYAGVTPAEASHVNAPYVAEALLVFECTLHDIIRFGDLPGSGTLILGQIRHIHIRDDLYDPANGHLDFGALDPVGRLAGNWYSTIRDRFELKRG